ncbi:MAG: hypothetical protein M1840_007886 [Geoglossum simile]|nr:MAG: hypothetical protein M1840_007886 [Geoglossum simile]
MDNDSPQDPASKDASDEFEFDQLRRRNDLRLKATFEAIFEKYGKDFTGVGDEIDLQTGQIVVDNGHISEMRDEQDVGECMGEDVGRLLRALTEQPSLEHESGRPNGGTRGRGGGEIYDSDDWDEGLTSEGSQGTLDQPHTEVRGTGKGKAPALADADGDLDQQISQYAVQSNPLHDSQVEPAWRAPGPAPPTPGARPILRSVLRSEQGISSPIQQDSLWAPPKRRGRRRNISSEFFHDVLVAPRRRKTRTQPKPPPPIVISDDEDDQRDDIPSNAGTKIQRSSSSRMESTSAKDSMRNSQGKSLGQYRNYPEVVLISQRPNQLYGPKTKYQQRPQKVNHSSGSHHPTRSTPVQTDLEAILEKFRRRIASERRRRNRNLHAMEPPILEEEVSDLTESPQERRHPSLKQIARDLFANSEVSTIGEASQDSHNTSSAANRNYSEDDDHMVGV